MTHDGSTAAAKQLHQEARAKYKSLSAEERDKFLKLGHVKTQAAKYGGAAIANVRAAMRKAPGAYCRYFS